MANILFDFDLIYQMQSVDDLYSNFVLCSERLPTEMDALRYYRVVEKEVDGVKKKEYEILWERWFHCYDLGKQVLFPLFVLAMFIHPLNGLLLAEAGD